MQNKQNKNKVIVIVLVSFLIISTNSLLSSSQTLSIDLVYSQSSQERSANNIQFDIYKVSIQKANVGDIEIAYKTFGNGRNTILLISGRGNIMNYWDPHLE